MKVEATLVHQTDGEDVAKSGCLGEVRSWERLFSPRYRQRTMIGVMIMVFQRERQSIIHQ
jgi:hypothetical protein